MVYNLDRNSVEITQAPCLRYFLQLVSGNVSSSRPHALAEWEEPPQKNEKLAVVLLKIRVWPSLL